MVPASARRVSKMPGLCLNVEKLTHSALVFAASIVHCYTQNIAISTIYLELFIFSTISNDKN